MRRIVPAALALVALSSIASALSTEAPSVALNDHWEFRIVEDGEGAGASKRFRADVVATETIVAGDQAVEAVVLRTQTNFSQANYTVHTVILTWLRATDGARLRANVSSITTSADFPESRSYSETTYDPPCPRYDWPIEVGRSTRTSCVESTVTSHSGSAPRSSRFVDNATHEVLREEVVDVPAGRFDALVIRSTREGHGGAPATVTLSWYAPVACEAVKQVTTTRATNTTTELLSHTCASRGAPPARAPSPPIAAATTTPTAVPSSAPDANPSQTPMIGMLPIALALMAAALALRRR